MFCVVWKNIFLMSFVSVAARTIIANKESFVHTAGKTDLSEFLFLLISSY